MVAEGYILYFRKWSKLQDSPKAKIKADQSESEIHSDIQCLAPGGSSKASARKNSLNQMTQHDHLEGRISDSQVNLQTCDKEVPP